MCGLVVAREYVVRPVALVAGYEVGIVDGPHRDHLLHLRADFVDEIRLEDLPNDEQRKETTVESILVERFTVLPCLKP
jgi:hypothetical protein